jgi:hypothetical protein
MLGFAVGVTVWLIVIPFFVLTLLIDHERGKRARAQIQQNVINSGGLDVLVIPDSRRRHRYRVEYQDGNGYLYTTECRVKFVKDEPHFSWKLVSKILYNNRVTADYDKLHEELKLLRINRGEDLFVEISDKEKAVWQGANDNDY